MLLLLLLLLLLTLLHGPQKCTCPLIDGGIELGLPTEGSGFRSLQVSERCEPVHDVLAALQRPCLKLGWLACQKLAPEWLSLDAALYDAGTQTNS